MNDQKTVRVHNSTAEFLIFTAQSGEGGIEVRVADHTVWLTQKLISTLFNVSIPTVSEHLTNLYAQQEISQKSTIRNFRTVQKEGSRDVTRNIEFYNLEAIIAVGFRINSTRAIQFRQWASSILRDFAIRGYVLDNDRRPILCYLVWRFCCWELFWFGIFQSGLKVLNCAPQTDSDTR